MLSVPVLADENDVWDLQEALRAVEAQFYATHANEEDSFAGDHTSPQWLTASENDFNQTLFKTEEPTNSIVKTNSIHLSWTKV